jgi:hypothetical protein
MFSPRTLHAVTVKLDGSYVSFRLRTHTHHEQNNMPTVEYSISSTGQLSRLEPQDLMTTFPIPSIRGVWHRTPIQRKLVELLPFPTKSVTYDLSNRIISHSLPERFHVNHDLRSIFIDSMRGSCISKEGSGTTFRVSMSTQDSKAAFGDFEALEDWIDHERPRDFRFRYILNPRGPWRKDPPITLNFQLNEWSTLEELRVEISELVFRTFALSLETTVLVQLLHSADIKDTASPFQASSTLYYLRRALLVFLSDIIASQPRLRPHRCPRIWADGRLRLREAEIATEDGQVKIVLNKKYNWDPPKIDREKERCLSRHSPGAANPNWGAYQRPRLVQESGDPQRPPPGTYETLSSCTTFLARFIKQFNYPEVGKQSWRATGGYTMIEYTTSGCAPWKLLGELREH